MTQLNSRSYPEIVRSAKGVELDGAWGQAKAIQLARGKKTHMRTEQCSKALLMISLGDSTTLHSIS